MPDAANRPMVDAVHGVPPVGHKAVRTTVPAESPAAEPRKAAGRYGSVLDHDADALGGLSCPPRIECGSAHGPARLGILWDGYPATNAGTSVRAIGVA
jgi:hypothetical protein